MVHECWSADWTHFPVLLEDEMRRELAAATDCTVVLLSCFSAVHEMHNTSRSPCAFATPLTLSARFANVASVAGQSLPGRVPVHAPAGRRQLPPIGSPTSRSPPVYSQFFRSKTQGLCARPSGVSSVFFGGDRAKFSDRVPPFKRAYPTAPPGTSTRPPRAMPATSPGTRRAGSALRTRCR